MSTITAESDITTGDVPASTPEETWPAVAVAYEFVRPAYEQMAKRLESVEARVRGLLTFGASLTFAGPTITTLLGLKPGPNVWLWLAIGCLVAMIALTMWCSLSLRIQSVDPRQLYDRTLSLSEWQFKKDMLAWAGDDFAINEKRLTLAGRITDAVVIALVLEMLCFGLWIALR